MFLMLSSVPMFLAEAESASFVAAAMRTGLPFLRWDFTAIVTGVAVIIKRKLFSTVFV